jgi:ParB family transcriptional regulator, chromosome partitioning protein
MTTSTAANVTGQEKDKEKVEKRRALGRGLDSLLPGPRSVGPIQTPTHAPIPDPVEQAKLQARAVAEVPTRKEEAKTASAEGQRLEGTISTETDPAVFAAQIAAEIKAEVQGETFQARETAAEDLASAESPGAPEHGITIYAQAETPGPVSSVVQLPITDIDKNPFQTRHIQSGEPLDELADSIRANGVLQPILVRPAKEQGRYVLILGERRLHASRKAGRTLIPAIVRKVSEQQAAEMTIIENLQREDLSPLEQAKAFKVLSEHFHMTQQQIGQRVGLSRESVANYMRLLRLPQQVMQLLAEKRLKFAEARELLRLQSNDQIAEAALFAVKKGMNLEQIERLVMRMEGLLDPITGMPGTQKKTGGARWVDPNVRAAQTELERVLGLRVKIRDRMGKGKILIEYSTVDDYERVVAMLSGKGGGRS